MSSSHTHPDHLERRLRTAIGVLILVIAGGTAGYMALESWTILDALYMTVTTITTVGFREVHDLGSPGRVFTMVLIVVGVGSTLYILGLFFQMFLEGHIRGVLGRRKMRKEVRDLHDHYIVCGYGRVGRQVVQELQKRKADLVVIENRPNLIDELAQQNVLYVPGDSTSDETLLAAGIERAKGLVIAIPGEADNAFIALSARQLTPRLIITARADSPLARSKILRAGANQVICPHEIGGTRMALSMLSPNVVDFMRIMAGDEETGLRFEEIEIGAGSQLAGRLLKDTPLRAELDVMVVGIKTPGRPLVYNPRSDTILEPKDILIVIGRTANLERLQELAAGSLTN